MAARLVPRSGAGLPTTAGPKAGKTADLRHHDRPAHARCGRVEVANGDLRRKDLGTPSLSRAASVRLDDLDRAHGPAFLALLLLDCLQLGRQPVRLRRGGRS